MPLINLGINPLAPLRKAIRDSRERIEKAGSDIRSLADDIHGAVRPERQTRPTAPVAPKEPSSQQSTTSTTSTSKLTNDEIIAYQNREIGRELWKLETHLSQGCRIPDSTGKLIPCDCCEKGTFISGLAYESIPIAERGGKPSSIYARIARWAEEMEPMVTVPAIESGQYDYKKLSGQASALRKELMGTTSLNALLPPKEQVTLEDAKKLAAEEAAREVEKRWESQENI